jgi:hypothetical protein
MPVVSATRKMASKQAAAASATIAIVIAGR